MRYATSIVVSDASCRKTVDDVFTERGFCESRLRIQLRLLYLYLKHMNVQVDI
jgi:hypothetical protein